MHTLCCFSDPHSFSKRRKTSPLSSPVPPFVSLSFSSLSLSISFVTNLRVQDTAKLATPCGALSMLGSLDAMERSAELCRDAAMCIGDVGWVPSGGGDRASGSGARDVQLPQGTATWGGGCASVLAGPSGSSIPHGGLEQGSAHEGRSRECVGPLVGGSGDSGSGSGRSSGRLIAQMTQMTPRRGLRQITSELTDLVLQPQQQEHVHHPQ